MIDGMGTFNRSKAFHDVAWKNVGDAGLPGPHPVAQGGRREVPLLRHQPRRHLRRIGGRTELDRRRCCSIRTSTRSRCSYAGCHDNRMDKIGWNEQWMGWPIDEHYAESSNVDNASRLQGKLLLVVGELDQNVDPASTMQVVNALIKANKMFDLLVVPGRRTRRGPHQRPGGVRSAAAVRLLRPPPSGHESA